MPGAKWGATNWILLSLVSDGSYLFKMSILNFLLFGSECAIIPLQIFLSLLNQPYRLHEELFQSICLDQLGALR